MSLTFQKLSEINLQRAKRWHKSDNLDDWSISDWAVAASGEMGEICNVVKKLRRLESEYQSKNDKDREINSKEQAIKEIGKEIADTVLYLNLLCIRCGLNLEKEIINKFNQVSEKYGFEERL